MENLKMGIDIGASKVAFVVMKGEKVLKKEKIAVPAFKQDLISLISKKIKEEKVSKAGIGVPSPLDKKASLVLNPPNLKYLKGCPLAKLIQKKTRIRTVMENDARCFSFAEAVLGAGRKYKTIFGLTLGSGIGGGLVIDRKIFKGSFGSAGEAGHTVFDYKGPECNCGSAGCFEEYCSQRFFFKRKTTPEKARKEAEKVSKKSLKMFKEYGKLLGAGLSSMVNLLDPEAIIIGGGISSAYKFFIKDLEAELKRRMISTDSRKYVKIRKAALGEWAGSIGAALVAEN
jgi:glucokinase